MLTPAADDSGLRVASNPGGAPRSVLARMGMGLDHADTVGTGLGVTAGLSPESPHSLPRRSGACNTDHEDFGQTSLQGNVQLQDVTKAPHVLTHTLARQDKGVFETGKMCLKGKIGAPDKCAIAIAPSSQGMLGPCSITHAFG